MSRNTAVRPVKRKKKKKTRLRAGFVVFLMLALAALLVICCTLFFPIKRISVSGSKMYTNAQIIKASGLTTDSKLLLVSEEKLQEKIRKTLPYVDSVKIKRSLPDAIILTVTDAVENACFKTSDGYLLVSKSGYVLSKCAEKPENVYEIITSGVSGEIGETVKYEKESEQTLVELLINELTKNNIKINSVDVVNLIEIQVSVEDKFEVLLGKNENIDKKAAHLASMIDEIGDRKGSIDLSFWTPESRQGTFKELQE